MTYLSRIWINPQRAQSRRLLGDRQAMHAAVLAGIPDVAAETRVLWRVDVDDPHRPGLLVLTRNRPSWEHLVEQAGWPQSDVVQAETRPYDTLLDRLAPDREFAFRLTANPAVSSSRPQKLTKAQAERGDGGELPRSTRLGHRTVRHQLDWLTSRVAGWGFEVPQPTDLDEDGSARDVRIVRRERSSFSRGRGGQKVTLQVVTYEGRMRVIDPFRLRDQLLAGFGPAKAYGCGLMTLAPLPERGA
ncbi:type I-E CRISPR-associated protein Cas6/Cse3/CasE [Nitriliruptoraceae bacterium ZYF776]|nr:type I-E CRISPR-associated protein Cas6/Cse3/CasE [Profundirhabdus halotolerans]